MQPLYDGRVLTIFRTCRQATSDASTGRRRGFHRVALSLTGLAAAVVFMLIPTLASADTSSTLTVIGTSDVSDSGLIPNLIGPQFEQAYPQFTFKYIGTASGSAITSAVTGSMGASALIVHAPTLENLFVAGGSSYQTTGSGPSTKPYGSAIWTNDFVLAGPTGDPAGVATNGSNDIAQAFVDVATAGLAGKATFVSRGGTPGTTTEEHAIWADVNAAGLTPAGFRLCAVPAGLGGGLTPIKPGTVSNGAACPGGELPTATAGTLPSWYTSTGLTQGPNVIAANACTAAVSSAGANTCYVFTDRGTYDYLASGTDPAGSVPNLKIVTRGPQASTAPGGEYALINYFHAYVLNPATVPNVNVTAAQDFVNFLTSPTVQNELQNYLPASTTGDPSGPPFVATANPTITITAPGIPATYKAGKPVTITGSVVNKELGFPALNGVPITVDQVVNGLGVAVPGATATTDTNGNFSLSFTPPVHGSYEVATQAISKVENSTLNPVFGDVLSPSASTATTVKVDAAITALKARSNGAGVAVFGTVAPGFSHVKGTVTISGRPAGSKSYKKLATVKLAATDGNFAAAPKLAPGKWQFKAVFADAGQVRTSPSETVTFTLGAKPKTSVSRDSTKVSGSSIKVPATVKPRAAAKGGVVKLLVLKATNPAKPQFNQKDKAEVRNGKNTVTLRTKLSGAGHYLLELQYSSKGSTSTYTTLRGVTIKSTK
jgi:tungstate transport system substrate-binding protein